MALLGIMALIFSMIALHRFGVEGAQNVTITVLESARAKGAVCLEGSPPSYAHSPGFGDGANNWHVHLQVYNITYRGARIYDAVMEELLQKGMKNAKNALLSGSSAGGLAAILHCDKFRALFLNNNNYNTRVKCLSDSGFFIQGEDFLGADWREIRFSSVISTHGLANLLPTSCTSKFSPTLCLFSENLVPDVQTPLFLIESAFDKFQISEQLFSPNNISKRWFNCTKNNLMHCNSIEIKIMKEFRTIFIKTLKNAMSDSSSNRGYFVHSCYQHVHILTKDYSTCSSLIGSNVLANKTVAQAVGDWYFDRSNFEEIDTHNDLPRNCSRTYPGQSFGPDFEEKCSHALHPNVISP